MLIPPKCPRGGRCRRRRRRGWTKPPFGQKARRVTVWYCPKCGRIWNLGKLL